MLGLTISSIRSILLAVLNQYPYKLQSCHELLSSDTVEKEAFARWAISKIEQDSSWVLNNLGKTKLIFRSMATLISITVASGRRQFHECTQRNH
ncbi:hypothetical protein NPIL_643541 [Nephila pilipes]|uniref:Uncharacterized protein n=1 Tax=Nephila pilipes TaxID=299642 RepID=A0A8X6NMD8_NEPPI|nr:hypothetical protein NPIL_643541 [Nephila pilipes]